MKKTALLFCWTALSLLGQSQLAYILRLENGAQVAYQTWSEEVRLKDGARVFGKIEPSGNSIRRILAGVNGKPVFGFEVRIDRLAASAFRVSFHPIPNVPFFAKAPVEREIEHGDRVLMDVLEHPRTGKKLFDMFQVGLPGELMFGPRFHSIPDVVTAESRLQLDQPALFRQSARHGEGSQLARSAGVFTGASLVLAVPGGAAFSLSSVRGPGYQMDAVAEDNTIHLVAGKDRLIVRCKSPIVARPGAWFLWVRQEPRALVAARASTELNVAAQKVEKR